MIKLFDSTYTEVNALLLLKAYKEALQNNKQLLQQHKDDSLNRLQTIPHIMCKKHIFTKTTWRVATEEEALKRWDSMIGYEVSDRGTFSSFAALYNPKMQYEDTIADLIEKCKIIKTLASDSRIVVSLNEYSVVADFYAANTVVVN